MGTFTQYAIAAARQALADADWQPASDEAKERTVSKQAVPRNTKGYISWDGRASALALVWAVLMISCRPRSRTRTL